MKQRVIAVLLILLLLAAVFVTGVFAEPDGDDTAEDLEPVAETTNHSFAPETTAATEAPEPVTPSSEAVPPDTGVYPAETNAPVTESPTEPEPEPTEPEPTESAPIDPEPPTERGEARLTLRVEEAPDRDLLFVIRGEDLRVEVVLPAGSRDLTVTGLPAGSYTVALDRSWNWQLKIDEAEAAQTVSLGEGRVSQTLTFRPETGPVSWLNACAGGAGK